MLKPMAALYEDGTLAVALSEGWRKLCVATGFSKLKKLGAKILPETFTKLRMKDVSGILANPSTQESHAQWSMNAIDIVFQIRQALINNSMAEAGSLDELITWHEDTKAELHKGARYPVDTYMNVGFKPV